MQFRIAVLAAWAASSAVALPSRAADPVVYSVAAYIVGNGSPVHAASACFGLDAVIAEPVAGISSGADYVLGAGFSYVAPFANDSIFRNGFEDCSQ